MRLKMFLLKQRYLAGGLREWTLTLIQKISFRSDFDTGPETYVKVVLLKKVLK